MTPSQNSDHEILDLAREFKELRAVLRHLRSQIERLEGRRTPTPPGQEVYLASLREQYGDGRRRVAEIQSALGSLHPVTLDAIRAKALALDSERTERSPSLRRAVVANAIEARRRQV
jgi:hypothetical protein